MLALLQKLITLTLIAAAGGWLLYFGRDAPVLAACGFLAILLGYALILASEFVISHQVNRSDPAPRPSFRQLLAAWLAEAIVAPRVFCWRQPFRSLLVPDRLAPTGMARGQRGAVLIHGFFCNRGFWMPWLERLRASGHAFIALDLEPVFGSIDDYVWQIDDAVGRITVATGLPPLLVCHSMGGLAVRAWLRRMKAEARVHHVVTIGTPHQGTWLARFGHGRNSRQMRPVSDWLAKLDDGMPPDRHGLFICWYSNCDNIVFPASAATLSGADNRLVQGAAHVELAFRPALIDATLVLLEQPFSSTDLAIQQ